MPRKKQRLELEGPPIKKIKVLTDDCFTNAISIEIIPKEVLCIIFSHLDRQSVKNVTATCKLWLEIIRGDSRRSSHVCLSSRHVSLQSFEEIIADLDFPLVRWPVLKTIKFRGYYPYLLMVEIILQYSKRLVDSGECNTLEKIIVSVSYSLDAVFSQFPCFGTIEEFTFSPRAELKSFQVEHITSLELELYPEEYEEIEDRRKISNGFKLIGETACNLKEITITIKSCSGQQDSKDSFKKDLCQMIKQLPLLQSIPINVPSLWYMETFIPDFDKPTDLFVLHTKFEELKSYDLTKIVMKFKKLRLVYIQVRLMRALSIEEEQWKKIQLPAILDQMFQDITEVKIVFYRSIDRRGNVETCFKVTKIPQHTAESSDILEGPRPMKYTLRDRYTR